MSIQINQMTFKTQTALHAYLNQIRILPSDEDFEHTANLPENFALLVSFMQGRPKKRAELAGRKVVRWTRVKRGPHWSFEAILDDGSQLDMGVSKADITEFVHNQPQG